MQTRKKIIVPTDFSKAAHNAYLYARELAKVYGCTVEVCHAYSDALTTGNVIKYMGGERKNEVLLKKAQTFVNDYPPEFEGVLTKVKVDISIDLGATVPLIVQKSKAEDVFMIVMGATGEHTVLENTVGTVSSKVAQEAHCPVILVPQFATFQFYENVLYASNFESVEEAAVQQIIDFAEIFRATIHFIHIKEKRETEDFTQTEEEIFNQLFKDGDPAFAFHLASVEAPSVMKGLNQYAKENKTDLMVLVNRQRGFLDSLSGKSTSKKMALNITCPVLIYHFPTL